MASWGIKTGSVSLDPEPYAHRPFERKFNTKRFVPHSAQNGSFFCKFSKESAMEADTPTLIGKIGALAF
jgi:hypothetical protein